MKQYLTVDQAAEVLHVSRRTLYTWLRSGQLQAARAGRKWLITQQNIDAFLSPTIVADLTEMIPAPRASINSSQPTPPKAPSQAPSVSIKNSRNKAGRSNGRKG